MSNNVFHFKQFSIHQSRSGMKVSADAVLFGSWIKQHAYERIFDIGTGTGLLSLMAAQRFEKAQIDTAEIDTGAYADACENIEKSPFANRINAFCADVRSITDVKLDIQNEKTNPFLSSYDLIICNPPFFASSLVSKDKNRETARHDQTLTPDNVFSVAEEYLSQNGSVCVMYPAQRLNEIKTIGIQHGFYVQRLARVQKSKHTPPRIMFLELTRNASKPEEEDIYMYNDEGGFTSAYKNLVGPFYQKLD